MTDKECNKCGQSYPETREFFGQYKNKRDGVVKIGYRNTCRNCMADNTKKWSSENYDRIKEKWNKRNQSQANAPGEYTSADILAIRRIQNDRCGYCGIGLNGDGEVDHKIPLSRGGSNFPENLILSCLSCNREKGSKTIDEYIDWRKERGLLCQD